MKVSFCTVMVAIPPGNKARLMALSILGSRLAACVNIIPRVESHYWWKGKLNKSAESLLLIKTQRKHMGRLIEKIKKIHPYDVPEIIALPILYGNAAYLKWLRDET